MMDLGKVRVEDVFGRRIKNARVSRGAGQSTQVVVEARGFRTRLVNLDFNPDTVDVVVMTMKASEAGPDTLESHAFVNIERACQHIYLRGRQLWSYMTELQRQAQDRLWILVDHRLKDILKASPQFDDAPGILHHPPAGGWERDSSYKTTREDPVLQVTFHTRTVRCPMCGGKGIRIVPDHSKLLVTDDPLDPDGTIETHTEDCPGCNGRSVVTEWMAEVDLDLKSGVGHWFEVLGNHVTHGKTSPHEVAQVLYVGWGILTYRPVPGGQQI